MVLLNGITLEGISNISSFPIQISEVLTLAAGCESSVSEGSLTSNHSALNTVFHRSNTYIFNESELLLSVLFSNTWTG